VTIGDRKLDCWVRYPVSGFPKISRHLAGTEIDGGTLDDLQLRQAALLLTANEVFAELLALSIVEFSYMPGTSITARIEGLGAEISDTGRGIQLRPDPGDHLPHAERAFTGVYPCLPPDPQVGKVLSEVVWGERGSLGPALANFACPSLEFISRRGGETWSQQYRYGKPSGPPAMLGAARTTGTTIRFATAEPIDRVAVERLANTLMARVPGLSITLRSP
jgi:hypothetical protein